MKFTHKAILSAKIRQNVENKAKNIAKNFLKLDDDRFEVEETCSDKITMLIRKVVQNEINKVDYKKGTAFLIKIRDGSKRRKLSPEFYTKELNLQHNTTHRRALSPKIRNTYIAVNGFNFQNDRYQEQSFSNKVKLIHIDLRSKESRAKKCRLEGCIKVMDKNSSNGEK